jgi:2-polyprenyl-3-methyl-5-hydroxy-6-metoxy-1,4-benzoquinol methylase
LFKHIRAFNLIEHLKNPRLFIYYCYLNLKEKGILELRTDNAWNPIHYIPNPFHVLSGSHTDEKYHYVFTKAKHTKHYYIFTKMHLRNLLSPYFSIKIIKYTTLFSRIYVLAEKNNSLSLAKRKLELQQRGEIDNDTFSEILL